MVFIIFGEDSDDDNKYGKNIDNDDDTDDNNEKRGMKCGLIPLLQPPPGKSDPVSRCRVSR